MSIIKTSWVLSGIAALCIIICVVAGVDIYVNRNERIFRESNVFFMLMILSGVIVAYPCRSITIDII